MAGIAGVIVLAPLLRLARENLALIVAMVVAIVVAVTCALISRKVYVRRQVERKQDRLRAVLPFHSMNDKEFEDAVASLCREGGCHDVRVCGGSGDRGVDVTARTPDGRRLIVQAKRYRIGNPVGDKDMQQFVGGINTWHEYDIAVLVTTSRFTRPARETAQRLGVRLVDNARLAAWNVGASRPPWDWTSGDV
ncbi:hypothetical protein GCM10023318_21660 [Nocardia callitridis]|uniref:Restriction endonuclease type IV Mrr domain-containing protein n=2 Tax=Nocardia callitridis TaxID=648753 RepID=A0ABP9K757_9NOCA